MGGAIFNHGGTLSITNSTLTANTATGGGGEFAYGGASGFGGAIFNLNGAVTLEFCTVDANTVATGLSPGIANSAAGGAVYSVGYNLIGGQAAALTIWNSILADSVGGSDLVSDQPSNVASAAGGGANVATASVTYAGANIVMSSSIGSSALTGPAPLTASPQLSPLALNAPGLTQTMAISTGSPALDAGVCDPNVTTDQRGVSRPQGSACDIGAYELKQQTPVITWANPSPIAYGTALSGAQLNATANVAGTFTYSPAAGTVPGVGSQTLGVSFAPTDSTDYKTATATTTLTVTQAASSATLTASTSQTASGTVAALSASLGPQINGAWPTGTVTFFNGSAALGSVTLANGTAALTTGALPAGSNTISAVYSGDTNFLGAASNTLTIVGIAPSSVSLQVQNTTLTYPGASNTVVTVTAKPGKPATGAVTIYDGATALTTQTLQGNSAAYWYISPGLNAGTHILTAVYSGDSNYPSGTSAAVTVTVSPVPVNLAVSCWNSSFPYGGNYSCTVNVSSNAGAALGSIVYSFDNGGAVSVPLSYGNAQFTLTQPVTGSHTVAISYAQQGNFAASNTNTQSFTVTAAPTQIQLTPSSYYIAAGSTLTLSVSLTSWSAGRRHRAR